MDTTLNANHLWSEIIGQGDAIDKILRSLQSGDGSHAWLFAGPRGVGKWTTAKVMAASLNCQENGCGSCVSCGKVMRELHPDVFLIEPEGTSILIDQVRVLLESVSLKNYEGATKVIIIDEADRMTIEAANILLKTLEEPPPDVVFILVTSNIEAMLPTIISRCRLVQFRPIPAREMAAFLGMKYGCSPDEAAIATKLSGGILGSAISFATSPTKKERRAAVLKTAQDVDRANLAELTFMAESFIREIKRPLDELKARHKKEVQDVKDMYGQKDTPAGVVRRLEQRQKRELSREEHQGFEEILSILATWFRDVILYRETGRDDLVTNQDHSLAVREHADLLTSHDVYECLRIIEETKQYSRFNVNMQLAFETMLFKINGVVAVQDSSYVQ